MKTAILCLTPKEGSMKRFLVIEVIPFFAGFLFAQDQRRTETTTTKTTWNGTLMDAACQSTHTEHKEASTKTNPDQSVTTKTETSHTETVDGAGTTTTTTAGILDPDGRYIPVDQARNTRDLHAVGSASASRP